MAAAADFYVAPQGNDAGPGTRDLPFASLSRALTATRQLSADTKPRIIVRSGSYWNISLVLGPQDSGLTLEAAPGESPILYGGQSIAGWEKAGEHFYAAPLPKFPVASEKASVLPDWEIRALEVNGQLRSRAQYPETGELPHLTSFDVPWMSSTGGGWKRKPTHEELTTLCYQPGLLPADLEVRNAEVTVYHMWDESCVGVTAHDPVKGILTLAPETGHPPGAFGVKKFVIWNTREGMTRPGQWYHDRVRNRIVYWPLPGENMNRVPVIAPTVTTILRLEGRRNDPVKHVTVCGLTFAVTTVPLVAGGFAAARFDGAVSLEQTEGCTFARITVRNVAGQGINGRRNVTATRIIDSEIAHCGAGGIYVGGTGSMISNNLVHAIGQSYPSAIGIFRGGRDCRVSHNEVHDCTYSAINYGGTGNVVEYNLIYDCMKVLHDGAAIYMFAATNCVLRGNVARDIIDTGGYGASAYYLDERSFDCVVEKNLSLRVSRPLHNHMATNNVIRDNVFVVPGDARLTFPRSTGFTMERNVLYATGKIRIEGVNAVTRWSKNLFFSGTGNIELVKLNGYRGEGTETGAPADTVVADPRFRDWQHGDCRFQPSSPANQLGIEPLDASRAGRAKGK